MFSFNVCPYLGEVFPQSLFIAVVDDLDEFLEFGTDVLHMVLRAWIEENFTQQRVVLREYPTRYLQVTLEGGV